MYGLPDDFDASIFVNRTLEQICINQNTIYFHFDTKIFISVESAYAYQRAESSETESLMEVPSFSVDVLNLLGSTIRRAIGRSDGTLILEFNDGQSLKFFDTSRQFESYKIDFQDRTIIV